MEDPPNGTIVDRLDAHGITWRDYYTDVPATAVIFSIPEKHPANMAPIAQFYADCAAGTLPPFFSSHAPAGRRLHSPSRNRLGRSSRPSPTSGP